LDFEKFASNIPGLSVYNYYSAIDATVTADSAVTLFFYCSAALASIICFFSLISSMYTNIREQTKEIGIIRAIGLTK